ncbi:MAG: YeeE/YedE family protein [Pseudomonadota bacterium]
MTAGFNKLPIAAATGGLIFVAWSAFTEGSGFEGAGAKLFLATLIGGFAGFSLYHASFGFTAGWRRIISESRSTGLRAQFLLIALSALCSYPLIEYWGANAWVHPMSVAMVVGAFLFGMGMQFGGGCGSGTLFVVGGGSTRMVITLTFFIIGSMLGVVHLQYWRSLPDFGRYSLINAFGSFYAFVILLVILAFLAFLAAWWEKRVHGSLEQPRRTGSFLLGPWSPWTGAMALAIVSVATLVVLNRPWGITQAFGLWGAKISYFAGVPTDSWLLAPWPDRAFERSVFLNATSVMDFGIILGAMIAAGLAGKWAPVWSLSRREVATAVIGGLLMGYGARLSYGCNIGAYLGGLVSGSMHAWVWALAAFGGSSLVVWFRMPRLPNAPQNVPS